jgi:hypothetical protein
MSYVKAAFWIFVVILLVPTNGQERYELYVAAQRTIADIGGFCTRNPDVCQLVASSVQNLGRKLKSTTDSIESMLRETGIAADRPQPYQQEPANRERQGAVDPAAGAATTSSLSGNTLTREDLGPAWRGPGNI